MGQQQFDYDWLVIGSGFGGSVSALRLAEKGYRVGILECGRRFRDEDFAKTDLGRRALLLDAEAGLEGHLPPDAVQGCVRRLRLRRRRRLAGVCQHAVPRAPRVLCGSADRRPGRLGARTGAALRGGGADARRGRLRPGHARRSSAETVRAGTRRRRDLCQDPGRRVSRRGGHGRARPLLRWRWPGADGVREVWAVHDRLPPRGEEHPGEELPVLRRTPGRRDPPGPDGDRRPAARSRRRIAAGTR